MDNFQKARANMIQQQIRPWQVYDERVLELMKKVPREQFVPTGYESVAYSDTAIPLTEDHAMMQPKQVARALQALDIQPTDTVLHIGAGTGYTTALLAALSDHVYAIESDPTLESIAKKNLKNRCKNVTLELGDGSLGWVPHAPYSVIFISGSYPMGLPAPFHDQLVEGGRCFAVVGQDPAMQAVLFTRKKQALDKQILFEASIPALLHAPQKSEFQF